YIISLAKSHSNDEKPVEKFLEKLKEANIPINTLTTSFAEELMRRLPSSSSTSQPGRTTKNASLYKQREAEAIELRKKNESYDLIELEDDTSDDKQKKKKKKKDKKKHLRK